MTDLEKIKAGVDFILEKEKRKLEGLSSATKDGKFTPNDPKLFKKYKTTSEFRVKFCSLVEDLVKDHVMLTDAVLDLFSRVEQGDTLTLGDIEGLKKVAVRLNK